jgi:hypothetical protein
VPGRTGNRDQGVLARLVVVHASIVRFGKIIFCKVQVWSLWNFCKGPRRKDPSYRG